MRFNKVLDVTALVLVAVCGQVARGITVNGDIEGDPPDTTYSGDNGVLSSPTGTTWNSIVHFVNAGSSTTVRSSRTAARACWTSSATSQASALRGKSSITGPDPTRPRQTLYRILGQTVKASISQAFRHGHLYP